MDLFFFYQERTRSPGNQHTKKRIKNWTTTEDEQQRTDENAQKESIFLGQLHGSSSCSGQAAHARRISQRYATEFAPLN